MEGATCMSTATDRILIKDLMLRCILGLSAEERREKQDVLINLILWTDLRPAAASDSIENAVDYSPLKKLILTRPFIAIPLYEIAPDLVLPDVRVPIRR